MLQRQRLSRPCSHAGHTQAHQQQGCHLRSFTSLRGSFEASAAQLGMRDEQQGAPDSLEYSSLAASAWMLTADWSLPRWMAQGTAARLTRVTCHHRPMSRVEMSHCDVGLPAVGLGCEQAWFALRQQLHRCTQIVYGGAPLPQT